MIETIVTEELSIGDYVLTGGEMAAMVVIDAVSRHVEGVLSNSVSTDIESFDNIVGISPVYEALRLRRHEGAGCIAVR